jgi:putative ABC transport system permease protein
MWVSGTFFDTVGVAPLRGRLLGPTDDMPGCPSPSVVLSERFWRRELGGRDLAPGETISLEGHRFEVAGITPARFFGVEVGHAFDVALPTCAEDLLAEEPRTKGRSSWWLGAIGRLAPGWTLAKANAHLDAISSRVFEAALPGNYDAEQSKNFLEMKLAASPAETGFSDLREDYSSPLWMLLGISALVLLIACANIANLMVARASVRQREIAIRLALGASRRRLVRQLLAESLVLAAAGALAGAALAQLLSRKLLGFLATHDTQWVVEMPLDLRLLAFTAGIAVATCVLFGLLPAVQASRTDPIEAMKSSGRGVAGGGARLAVRRALVVSQIALSLVLLVGALLFVRSLRNLLTLDAGFGRDHVLVVTLDHTRLHVPKEQRVALRNDALEHVRAVPGVLDASVARLVPLGGRYWNDSVSIEGTTVRHQTANFNQVGPGYFRAIGSKLLAGRDFTAQDDVSGRPVAIVTETFARKFLAGASPIGRTVQIDNQGGDTVRRFEIVGLAQDSKYFEMREDFQPLVYLSQAQDRDPRPWFSIIVRSNLPLSGLLRTLTSAVGSVNPQIDLQFQPMSVLLRDGLVREQLMASLSAFFGFLAALLATIGLYGVVSYMVVRRRNEIGVRMALGATRGDILGLVLWEAGTLLAVGLGVGTVLALGAAALARSLLFGLKPTDPATFVLAALGLAAVAVLASLLPAHRAATLDPVTALRDE